MPPGFTSSKNIGGNGNRFDNKGQQRAIQGNKHEQENGNDNMNSKNNNEKGTNLNNTGLGGGFNDRKPEELLLERFPSFFDTDEDPKQLLMKKLNQCLVVLDIPIGYTLNMGVFQNNTTPTLGSSPSNSSLFTNKKKNLLKMGSTSSLFDSLGDGMNSKTMRKDFMIYNKIIVLQEIRDFLRSSPSGIYTKEICMAIIEVVKTNIFRTTVKNEMQCNTDDEFGGLEPISVTNDSGNTIDVMVTMVEYSWDILLRMVISPQFTDKIALELLSANFLTELIECMINMSSNSSSSGSSSGGSGSGAIGGISGLGGAGSNCGGGLGCPQNECEYAKTVLHRLYAKYMPMRNILRLLISSALKEMSEYQATSSTTFNPLALLDVLSSIVNGYTTPLKQEHINMLSNVLLPLHKNSNLSTYHTQLVSVIKVFIQKDPSLIVLVLNKVIEMYPKINSSKELLFISEIGDFVDISNHQYLKPIFGKIIDLLCMASMSPSVQVAEKALTTLEKDSLFSFIRDSPNQYGAMVLLYLQMNKTHWACSIQNSSQRVIDKIIKAINGNGGYYNQQQGNSKISLDKTTLSLIQKKQSVVTDKISKEYSREAENAKFWNNINNEIQKKLVSKGTSKGKVSESYKEVGDIYKEAFTKFTENPVNPLGVDWVYKHASMSRQNSNASLGIYCNSLYNSTYNESFSASYGSSDANQGVKYRSSTGNTYGSNGVDDDYYNYKNMNNNNNNNNSNGFKDENTYSNTNYDTNDTKRTDDLETGSKNNPQGWKDKKDYESPTQAQLESNPAYMNNNGSKNQVIMDSSTSNPQMPVASNTSRRSPLVSPPKQRSTSSSGHIQSQNNINIITNEGNNGNGQNYQGSQSNQQGQRRLVRRKSGSSTSQYKVARSMSGERISGNERGITSSYGTLPDSHANEQVILTHTHNSTSSRTSLQPGIQMRYIHSSSTNHSMGQMNVPPMEEYPGQGGVMKVKKKKKTKRRLNYVNETGNILLAPMANGY